jgi:hypothetical protein
VTAAAKKKKKKECRLKKELENKGGRKRDRKLSGERRHQEVV